MKERRKIKLESSPLKDQATLANPAALAPANPEISATSGQCAQPGIRDMHSSSVLEGSGPALEQGAMMGRSSRRKSDRPALGSPEERRMPQANATDAGPGKNQKRYDEAFKRAAVEHWMHSAKPARAISAELGIHTWNLRDWKRQYGPPESSVVAWKIAELEAENRALRRELLVVQQQVEILRNLSHSLPGHRRKF
jgi:transposase-like protein